MLTEKENHMLWSFFQLSGTEDASFEALTGRKSSPPPPGEQQRVVWPYDC